MPKPPALQPHAAALVFATERIAFWRETAVPLWPLPALKWLDKTASHRYFVEMIKLSALAHPSNTIIIVDYARQGWDLADTALRELILEFHDRREQLPTYLASYNMEIVHEIGERSPRPRGPKKSDIFLRNIVLASIIGDVAERFGLNPTRNRTAARKPSACLIVAQALATNGMALSEDALVTIWKRHQRAWGKLVRYSVT